MQVADKFNIRKYSPALRNSPMSYREYARASDLLRVSGRLTASGEKKIPWEVSEYHEDFFFKESDVFFPNKGLEDYATSAVVSVSFDGGAVGRVQVGWRSSCKYWQQETFDALLHAEQINDFIWAAAAEMSLDEAIALAKKKDDWTPVTPEPRGFSRSQLIRRGWKESQIDELLGSPDRQTPNLFGKGVASFYFAERVESAENQFSSQIQVLADS
jgi:hypothetical protein